MTRKYFVKGTLNYQCEIPEHLKDNEMVHVIGYMDSIKITSIVDIPDKDIDNIEALSSFLIKHFVKTEEVNKRFNRQKRRNGDNFLIDKISLLN